MSTEPGPFDYVEPEPHPYLNTGAVWNRCEVVNCGKTRDEHS